MKEDDKYEGMNLTDEEIAEMKRLDAEEEAREKAEAFKASAFKPATFSATSVAKQQPVYAAPKKKYNLLNDLRVWYNCSLIVGLYVIQSIIGGLLWLVGFREDWHPVILFACGFVILTIFVYSLVLTIATGVYWGRKM